MVKSSTVPGKPFKMVFSSCCFSSVDISGNEHALELFYAKGGGKMRYTGLPQSRLAIIPGTTHIGMMQRTDWLMHMLMDFLDSDLNTTPPTF